MTIMVLLLFFPSVWVLWWLYKERFHLPLIIPTTANIPFFGSAPFLKYDGHEYFNQLINLSEKFHGQFVLWFGPKPVIFTDKITVVQGVLCSQNAITKSSLYIFLHDWLGLGLLTSNGVKWKTRRNILTPAFHFNTLKDYVPVFKKHAQNFVSKLDIIAVNGEVVDVQPLASLCTLDVICETTMGVELNLQKNLNADYVQTVKNVNIKIQQRIKSPWLWPDIIYRNISIGRSFYKDLKTLHGFTTQIINKRIQDRLLAHDTVDRKNKSFLDILLDAHDKGDIDVEGIREEVDTFVFEGHDTTSSALSWTLYLLADHPNVQKKLYNEVSNWKIKELSFEDMNQLQYLDSVIKESLRLRPPVPYYGRILEEDTVIDGLKLKKDTEIIISAYTLQRKEELWENPSCFYPERFLQEEIKKRNCFSFIPFSAGPRNCIGKRFAMSELKIIVFEVISNFTVVPEANQVMKPSAELIHHSTNGINLMFQKRV